MREENNVLRAKINSANYNNNSVEQYTRRENVRLHDVPEYDDESDQGWIQASEFEGVRFIVETNTFP